ncbi:MAG: hypothetical protein E7340_01335 [Clostridiales bacterium]|nr:hypothetical protein [Clostridiales bacterium]
MINLFLTNSYFNLFPILTKNLAENSNGLDGKRIVFCEAKVSLMIERMLCDKVGGSFNTEVYSFGKFLSARKNLGRVLSKEGSAMAIKRILSSVSLVCFNQSTQNFASSLYDLIIQLKSAKVKPEDVEFAAQNTRGVLKNKLTDIYKIYLQYEKYVKDNGFEDQSSLLSYLPDLIDNSAEIKGAEIFVVGFSSFTAQARDAVSALIKSAKQVTFILTEGDNPFSYVNETSNFVRTKCKELSLNLFEKRFDGDFSVAGSIIADNIFSPTIVDDKKLKNSEEVYFSAALNPYDEIMRVGEIIRRSVLDGECKFKDFTIALDDAETYRDSIRSVFNALEIPYYLDEQIVPLNHPLVTLILSYIETFRSGFDRKNLLSFLKNPLVMADKNLTDEFENYLIKYNVNRKRIFAPFAYPADSEETLVLLESTRDTLCQYLSSFNISALIQNLGVKEKLEKLALSLSDIGEVKQAKITEQIYNAIEKLLSEMTMILDGVKLSLTEYKNLFLIGVCSLKMSIIPQYNDAVFIGGFKETALAKAKRLFAIGLTSAVPAVQADVSLLSDVEISSLEQIKVLVEPKIKVVNHRMREKVAMALSAFSERLYLSYPTSTVDGKQNDKSLIIDDIAKLFTLKPFPALSGYLSRETGYKTFARECGDFVLGKRDGDFNYDFTIPSSFYAATGGEGLESILKAAQKQVKERLDGESVSLIKSVVSPTAIEEYYRCPFRAFISHSLRVREREEGQVKVLSVGNLMHDILKGYVRGLKQVSDKTTSDALFEKVSKTVLEKDEYKKYLTDFSAICTVNRVLRECKEYCYKTYLSLDNSNYTICKTEVGFGENAEYPAIPLCGGKVKLKGKIDRVDENDEFFRILDYKTGKADASEKALFAGVKLQLYLYAAAVMGKYNDAPKTPAGLYYLAISNKYESKTDKKKTLAVGKTLKDRDALISQDKEFFDNGGTNFTDACVDEKSGKIKNAVDKLTLSNCIDYALKISELAAERLDSGVIVPSPYENACEFCSYSALCGVYNADKRSVGGVKAVFSGDVDDE